MSPIFLSGNFTLSGILFLGDGEGSDRENGKREMNLNPTRLTTELKKMESQREDWEISCRSRGEFFKKRMNVGRERVKKRKGGKRGGTSKRVHKRDEKKARVMPKKSLGERTFTTTKSLESNIV